MLYRQMSKWKEWGEKEQIRLDLEEARAKALADGRTEGHAEGRAEGRTEGRAEGRAEGRTEGRAEGRTEGRAEGRTEGRAEGTLSIARKMKEMGLPVSQIAEVTGLTADEVTSC
jgi:predicted transposase/invertase (TIGR01784 family)